MKVGQLYKTRMSATIKKGVVDNASAFVVSFRGVSSAQMNVLRKDLKRKKANVLVSKTSVSRIALKEAQLENLASRISGQTAFVLSDSDASEISKILVKFAKDCEGFVVQGGVLNGDLLNPEQIKTLSDLPSREVLLAKLLGVMAAPISRFNGALNAKTRDFMSILKQKSEKGGS